MRLASVRIDRYGPLAGVEHAFDGGLEVCYGPNESGKTLFLDAVLRLCSTGAVDVVPDVGRVEEPPVGHAVLETGAMGDGSSGPGAEGGSVSVEEHVLGDGATLGDVTDVTPRQLRNVFVVRDADLRLGDEHDFYDATARRLADLHTRELDALRERIVDAGRLTPTTLNLSDADRYGDAATVREDAAALAAELREYVAECRESGVEAAERERVEVAAELERARRSLERQEVAEVLATHRRLAGALDAVREATETLADRDCTGAGLDRLETIDAELERIADDLSDCEDRREALRDERRSLEATLAETEAELSPLADRLSEIEVVERALERYREDAASRDATGGQAGDSTGGPAVRVGGTIAVAAALGAGASALAGVIPIAALLAVSAAVGLFWAVGGYRSARAARASRRTLLETARDAGLDVEAVAEVAPAIREFRDEHARLADRVESIEGDLALVERRVADVESTRDDAIERRRALRRERRELLQEAGVPDVAEYRDAVASAEDLAAERREATATLAERLGDRADASMADRIEHWERELEALRATVDGAGAAADSAAVDDAEEVGDAEEIDDAEKIDASATVTDADAVDADAFDPDELDRLEERVASLEDRRAALRERLDAHERALEGFANRLGSLPTGRFRDDPIALSARSVEGLAATAADLESLVDDLDRDADVSRVALAALEDVRAEEEAKLAELFGPGSTATETFGAITDGRYEAVAYDPDAESLAVSGADGTVLTPRELSRGTTDQLYLAARIGLAEQLLHGEPGFLLLDDPLLPADPERLEAGFDALRSLADAGWQVVYWTAKPEVGEALVERHGVPCRRFERLG